MNIDEYRGYNLYFFEEKFNNIAKKIIDNNYEVIKAFKESKRNYVALVNIDGEEFILKSPRNEFRIPQRRVMTLFKKGEALTSLTNVERLRGQGLEELTPIYLAINRREKKMIAESFILLKKVDSIEEIDYTEHRNLAVETAKKMHELNVFHGDCNPSNFIIDKEKRVHIIDTKAETMSFGNYRAHYDMLTMKIDSYGEMIYPYKKNIFYYMALFMKKTKRNSTIKKIKKKKKKLRDKGWKI